MSYTNDFTINVNGTTTGSAVRKNGVTGNTGSSASPKGTIETGLSVGSSSTNCYVLDGDYITGTISNSTRGLVGDGNVTLYAQTPQVNSLTFSGSFTGLSFMVSDLKLVNYLSVNADNAGNYALQKMYLKNIGNITTLTRLSILNNCGQNLALFGYGFFSFCNIHINQRTTTTLTNAYKFIGLASYIDDTHEFIFTSTTLTAGISQLLSSCCGALFTFGANKYVIPKAVDLTGGGTGTVAFASRTGTYPTGATEWLHTGLGISATTCYITNGNFNADPMFNDLQNEDFTVSASSPLINKSTYVLLGTLYPNIGNVKVATNVSPFSGWALSGVTLNADGSYTGTGTLTSPVFTISTTLKKAVGLLNYVGGIWNDMLSAVNTAYVNENVPRILSYSKQGSTITNNSPRLSIKMRMSTLGTTPSVSTNADWDNNGYNGLNAGDYFIVDPKKIPSIDVMGFGNADSSFNNATEIYPVANWFMIEIYINGNSQG